MTESTFESPTTERLGTLLSDHAPGAPGGGRVDAVNVSQHVGARQILQELSLSVEPGELVAIAGGSGAGKSTLLEILAGLQPPSGGEVRHDGVVRGARVSADSRIGYVPQDDIIHLEMPLRRTLRYAARLRLPAGTSAAEADLVVEETMHDLDLADRAEVPVRALSGGQRKRASIAVELLTRPRPTEPAGARAADRRLRPRHVNRATLKCWATSPTAANSPGSSPSNLGIT
jgi:ABC transport system ATP-binding/permease protein